MVGGRRRVTYSHRKMRFLRCNESTSRSGCNFTKLIGDRTQLTFTRGQLKKFCSKKINSVVLQLVDDPLKRGGKRNVSKVWEGNKIKGAYVLLFNFII